MRLWRSLRENKLITETKKINDLLRPYSHQQRREIYNIAWKLVLSDEWLQENFTEEELENFEESEYDIEYEAVFEALERDKKKYNLKENYDSRETTEGIEEKN